MTRAARGALLALAAAVLACGEVPEPGSPPAPSLPAELEAKVAAAAHGKADLSAEELRAALASPVEKHRIQALAWARGHASPAATDALARATGSTDHVEVQFAVEALMAVNTEASRRRLGALPSTLDAALRRRVCQHLARESGPSEAGGLLPFLEDGNPEVRQMAARGLSRLVPKAGDAILPAVRRLAREGDASVRLAALSVLGSYPASVARADFERALLEGPEAVAEVAAEALVRFGGNEGLAPELAAGRPARARVARVLARSGARAALDPFTADPDPGVRLAACYGRDADARPAPLVLLVVVDTLRADRLAGYGHHLPVSTHLDRLGRRGTIHAEARAHSPWTLASHVALFTSRYASELGVRDIADALPSGAETLAESLAARGHVTAAVTSVPYLTAAYGLHQGFHWLESQTDQRAGRVVARALPILRSFRALSAADRPPGFLLFVHLFDPHEPYDPPAAWTRTLDPAFSGTYDPMKREGLTPEEEAHVKALYDGEVAYADEEIARLLAWLDRLGFRDRDVWITSDHGEELRDHDRWGHGWTLFEEQLRVPLLAVLRGEPPALHTSPVRLVDVMPRLLARAGVPVPEGARGRLAAPGTELAYGESGFKGISLASLVDGRRKVIRDPGRSRIFDVEADPAERDDVSGAVPGELRELERRLEAECPASERILEAPAGISPEALESLRALGYLAP